MITKRVKMASLSGRGKDKCDASVQFSDVVRFQEIIAGNSPVSNMLYLG
jgi:hypothetical protein